MALIALRNIRCIDYLAYVSIFTCATFRPKITLMFFFPARKAVDERWGAGGDKMRLLRKEVGLSVNSGNRRRTKNCSNFVSGQKSIMLPIIEIVVPFDE